MSQIPNILTLLRLLAAPVISWLIIERRFGLAALLLLPIGISDWFDGYFARRFGAASQIGAYLDPAADKVLLVVGFVSIWWIHAVPLWLMLIVLGRDLVIVVGIFLLWRLRGRTRFLPLMSGKLSTFFQISMVVLVVIAGASEAPFLRPLLTLNMIATTFFTLLSGLSYVLLGIRMASRSYVP